METMSKNESANVHQTYRPLELFLKFVGILPLFWPSQSTRRLTRLQKASNWTYFTLNYLISVWVIHPSKRFSSALDGSVHIKFVGFLCQTISFGLPLITLSFGYITAATLKQLLRQLHGIDYKLRMVTFTVFNYRKHYLLIVWFLTTYVFLTVVLVLVSLVPWTVKPQLITTATSIRIFLMLVAVSVQFISTVLLIISRIEKVSEAFRMYFPTNPTSGGFLTTGVRTETIVCNEKEQLAVLKQIKILHDKLNDVVELVNYCFSVQITFCVGLCFVIGVVCSFGLFRAFIYRNELFYMGVLNFIWYMYYLFFVLFFIAVGSKITREGKRIGVLVHKAINCSTSSAVINELNIFSQQLLHRSPVITCGLFVYDWTLLYTMIGATATYLIILIQFDVSFPNLVNVNGTTAVSTGA